MKTHFFIIFGDPRIENHLSSVQYLSGLLKRGVKDRFVQSLSNLSEMIVSDETTKLEGWFR